MQSQHGGRSSPGQGAQALRRRQLRLEAVHLAAEVVAAHRHVQAAHQLLTALFLACDGGRACGRVRDCRWPMLASHEKRRTEGAVGQEDQPRARAPHRPPGGGKLAQRWELWTEEAGLRRWSHRTGAPPPPAHQVPALCDERHGRALAPGDDQALQLLQLVRLAHLQGQPVSGSHLTGGPCSRVCASAHTTQTPLVRTSTALAPAFSRHTQCSRKEPCRASTPTRGVPVDICDGSCTRMLRVESRTRAAPWQSIWRRSQLPDAIFCVRFCVDSTSSPSPFRLQPCGWGHARPRWACPEEMVRASIARWARTHVGELHHPGVRGAALLAVSALEPGQVTGIGRGRDGRPTQPKSRPRRR